MDADALARKVADHLRAREGTGKAFDIVIDEVREGYARIEMVVRADMLNGHGVAHGGMIFTLADTAFAYACNSRNVSTMANQASIVFLSPGKGRRAADGGGARAGRLGPLGRLSDTGDRRGRPRRRGFPRPFAQCRRGGH